MCVALFKIAYLLVHTMFKKSFWLSTKPYASCIESHSKHKAFFSFACAMSRSPFSVKGADRHYNTIVHSELRHTSHSFRITDCVFTTEKNLEISTFIRPSEKRISMVSFKIGSRPP